MTAPGFVPSGLPQLPRQVQNVADRSTLNTEIRVGKVISYNSGTITLLVGGAQIPGCAYISTYLPVLGDYVIAGHQSSQWIVLGQIFANPATNAVQNPSFEAGALGAGAPFLWGTYHFAGTSVASYNTVTMIDGTQLDGPQAMQVFLPNSSATGSKDYAYSSPIPVVPGEVWSVYSWVQCWSGWPADSYAVCTAFATWYADNTSVYPNTVAADSGNFAPIVNPYQVWQRLPVQTNGLTVPAGATYMRVALYSNITAKTGDVNVYWDHVVAIKIKNADGTYAP